MFLNNYCFYFQNIWIQWRMRQIVSMVKLILRPQSLHWRISTMWASKEAFKRVWIHHMMSAYWVGKIEFPVGMGRHSHCVRTGAWMKERNSSCVRTEEPLKFVTTSLVKHLASTLEYLILSVSTPFDTSVNTQWHHLTLGWIL